MPVSLVFACALSALARSPAGEPNAMAVPLPVDPLSDTQAKEEAEPPEATHGAGEASPVSYTSTERDPLPSIDEPRPQRATSVRQRARLKGNFVLLRNPQSPSYSAAGTLRMGVQLRGGAKVIQPVGYGFGLRLLIHFASIERVRFGFVADGGHQRYRERRSFERELGDGAKEEVQRFAMLTHTDFSLGPSAQIPVGPVFLVPSLALGLAISSFERPTDAEPQHDERIDTADLLLRGGLSLGFPLRNDQGLLLAADLNQIFSGSGEEDLINPGGPIDSEDTDDMAALAEETGLPLFDLHLVFSLGYQAWF